MYKLSKIMFNFRNLLAKIRALDGQADGKIQVFVLKKRANASRDIFRTKMRESTAAAAH